ncbi:MAG: hypothetical protein LBS00_07790 [Synergistaceae bacterium]|jgi:hypothetical protein|nr:hypothetical protein [Synergistaceae bacterium]
MTYDEIRKLPNDVLQSKVWLALREPFGSIACCCCVFATPPEYTKNFNELYEAEKKLSAEQYSKYVSLLLNVVEPLAPEMEEAMRQRSEADATALIACAAILRATARQRTEALTMTLRGSDLE